MTTGQQNNRFLEAAVWHQVSLRIHGFASASSRSPLSSVVGSYGTENSNNKPTVHGTADTMDSGPPAEARVVVAVLGQNVTRAQQACKSEPMQHFSKSKHAINASNPLHRCVALWPSSDKQKSSVTFMSQMTSSAPEMVELLVGLSTSKTCDGTSKVVPYGLCKFDIAGTEWGQTNRLTLDLPVKPMMVRQDYGMYPLALRQALQQSSNDHDNAFSNAWIQANVANTESLDFQPPTSKRNSMLRGFSIRRKDPSQTCSQTGASLQQEGLLQHLKSLWIPRDQSILRIEVEWRAVEQAYLSVPSSMPSFPMQQASQVDNSSPTGNRESLPRRPQKQKDISKGVNPCMPFRVSAKRFSMATQVGVFTKSNTASSTGGPVQSLDGHISPQSTKTVYANEGKGANEAAVQTMTCDVPPKEQLGLSASKGGVGRLSARKHMKRAVAKALAPGPGEHETTELVNSWNKKLTPPIWRERGDVDDDSTIAGGMFGKGFPVASGVEDEEKMVVVLPFHSCSCNTIPAFVNDEHSVVDAKENSEGMLPFQEEATVATLTTYAGNESLSTTSNEHSLDRFLPSSYDVARLMGLGCNNTQLKTESEEDNEIISDVGEKTNAKAGSRGDSANDTDADVGLTQSQNLQVKPKEEVQAYDTRRQTDQDVDGNGKTPDQQIHTAIETTKNECATEGKQEFAANEDAITSVSYPKYAPFTYASFLSFVQAPCIVDSTLGESDDAHSEQNGVIENEFSAPNATRPQNALSHPEENMSRHPFYSDSQTEVDQPYFSAENASDDALRGFEFEKGWSGNQGDFIAPPESVKTISSRSSSTALSSSSSTTAYNSLKLIGVLRFPSKETEHSFHRSNSLGYESLQGRTLRASANRLHPPNSTLQHFPQKLTISSIPNTGGMHRKPSTAPGDASRGPVRTKDNLQGIAGTDVKMPLRSLHLPTGRREQKNSFRIPGQLVKNRLEQQRAENLRQNAMLADTDTSIATTAIVANTMSRKHVLRKPGYAQAIQPVKKD